MKKNVLPTLLFLVLLLSSCSSVDNKETSPNDQKSTSLTFQTTDPINSNQGGGQNGGQGGGQGANTSNTPFIPPQTSTSDGHTHNLVMEHLNEQSVTCTQGGYYLLVYKCSICQQIFAQQDVNTPALGHNFVEYNREDATYEHATKIYERCSRCEQENIRYSGSPLKHNYSHEYSYDDNYHWHQCVDAGYEELYEHKVEHSWAYENQVYHVVSETEDGYTETPCQECGYVRITGYEPAYNKRTYHWCGEYPNDWRHYYTWLDENNELKTSEIQYCHRTEIGRQNPDYDVDGYYTDVCDECHHEYTQILPGYEHNWSIGWNETQHYEYCTDEGYHELKRNFEDHIFDIVEQHRSTDANPKYIDGSTYGLSNNSQDWNLVVCSVCGCEQKIDLHHYSDSLSFNDSNHFYACTDPGYENLYKNSEYHYNSSGYYHTTGEATFEHAAYDYYSCTCGYEHYDYHGNALPHNYSDELSFDETHHWHACTDTGYETLFIDKDVHHFGGWITDTEPSISLEGVKHHVCEDCSYVEYGSIPTWTVTSEENMEFTYLSETDSYGVSGGGYSYKYAVIPETHEGKPVTKVMDNAFKDDLALSKVVLPSNLTSIGSNSFKGCTNLTTANVPISVTEFGSSAFEGCSSLEEIIIPEGVTTINSRTFYGCSSLESVVVPDSVVSIGRYAFQGCSSLESISLPFIGGSASTNNFIGYIFGAGDSIDNADYVPTSLENVVITGNSTTSITQNSFKNCANIKSIVLPESVQSIAQWSFYQTPNLVSLTIPFVGWTPNYKNFLGYIFGAKQYSENATYIPSTLRSVTVIGNAMTTIPDHAFYSCGVLTSIVLPEGITSIGEEAFYVDYSLQSIVIPNGVETIGERAFQGCSGLTSVTIPNSVTTISSYVFISCTHLEEITFLGSIDEWNAISKSVTSLGTVSTIHCNNGDIVL